VQDKLALLHVVVLAALLLCLPRAFAQAVPQSTQSVTPSSAAPAQTLSPEPEPPKVGKPKPSQKRQAEQSPELAAFIPWRDSVGLSDVFSVVSEDTSNTGRYKLVLKAYYLENSFRRESQAIAYEIYRDVFVKVAAITGLPPDKVELGVLAADGYCDPPIILNTITMPQDKILVTPTEYSPGGGALCELNFEYISKKEAATKKAVGQLPQRLMSKSRVATTPLTTEKVKQYLSERYTAKGGAVTVTSISKNWLAATVRHLRHEVISDKNYWERLQIVIVLDHEDTVLRTRLVLDGRYASGLAAPSDLAYGDMEPVYTSYLDEYGQTLVLAVGELK
jgi:hypothetical protein